MQHRDDIRELATAVGRGLSAYIAVHNTIFQDASTFKERSEEHFRARRANVEAAPRR
jgi:hypothetical protein